MKMKYVFSTIIAALVIISTMPVLSVYADTEGCWKDYISTPTLVDNTYLITTASDLAWVAVQVNDGASSFEGYTIKLTDAVDLSAHFWLPIGLTEEKSFKGSFDGNNKIISNVKIGTADNPDNTITYGALFGYLNLSEQSNIKDVTLENVSIYLTELSQDSFIGSLAGKVNGGTIINCKATGTINVTGDESYIAGLVGGQTTGNIINCSSSVNITGGNELNVGGVIGLIEGIINNDNEVIKGTINNCVNYGTITDGEDSITGGVIANICYSTAFKCTNAGNINSGVASIVGGTVGFGQNATIQNCHNSGSLTTRTATYTGGVMAEAFNCTLQSCYNTGNLAGNQNIYIGGVLGGSFNSLVDTSFNTGAFLSTSDYYKGGIVSYMSGGAVQYSYNTSNMDAEGCISVGGIVNINDLGTVQNNYNLGIVSGSESSPNGCVIARSNGIVLNNFYLQDTVNGIPINIGKYGYIHEINTDTDISYEPSNEGAEPKYASDMKTEEFVSLLNGSAENFHSDGGSINNGYPILTYQSPVIISYSNNNVTILSPTTLTNSTLLIAAYSNNTITKGCLIGADTIKDISVEAGQATTVPVELPENTSSDDIQVKIFLWDNLNSMKPLADPLLVN